MFFCVFFNLTESDRESTSSSLTAVNERQIGGHFLTTASIDQNLSPTSAHPLTDKSMSVKSLQSLNSSLPVPVKKVGRRGRPPKKDAKSRNRQGSLKNSKKHSN